MNSYQVLVLIPARYGSLRFSGKPLAEIAGKSMIQRVFENCQEANRAANSLKMAAQVTFDITFEVWVVTDHALIEEQVKSFSSQVLRVDDVLSTGSERIYLAWQRHLSEKNYQFIINVQGDEPLLGGEELARLVCAHQESSFDIFTLVKKRSLFPSSEKGKRESFNDSSQVKVAFCPQQKHCLYFSRAPIPHGISDDVSDSASDRASLAKTWYQHLGVYSYRPDALKNFCASPPGYLESCEKLEQLRALELGLSIGGLPIEKETIGVDEPGDIAKVEEQLELELELELESRSQLELSGGR